jgi:glutamyl/glutaminyl-tRNA synthetase
MNLTDWKAAAMEEFARSWSAENSVKMRDIAMPLRMALTGMKVSPGVFEVAGQLGREEAARRLRHFGFLD